MKTDNPPSTKSAPPDPSQPARGTDSPQPAAPSRDRADEASDASALPNQDPPRATPPSGTPPDPAQPPHPTEAPAFPANAPASPASSPAPEGQGTVPPAAAATQGLSRRSPSEAEGEVAQSLASPPAIESGRGTSSSADSDPSPSLAAGREAGERQRAQEEELAALLDGVVRGQERMLGVLNRAVDSLAGFQARLDALESRLRDVDLRHQSMRNAGMGTGL